MKISFLSLVVECIFENISQQKLQSHDFEMTLPMDLHLKPWRRDYKLTT
jgi:hypothetical protein